MKDVLRGILRRRAGLLSHARGSSCFNLLLSSRKPISTRCRPADIDARPALPGRLCTPLRLGFRPLLQHVHPSVVFLEQQLDSLLAVVHLALDVSMPCVTMLANLCGMTCFWRGMATDAMQ